MEGTEQHGIPEQISSHRVGEERQRRREAGRQTFQGTRVEHAPGPHTQVGESEEQHRAAQRRGGQRRHSGLTAHRVAQQADENEGAVDPRVRRHQGLAHMPEVEGKVGNQQGQQRHTEGKQRSAQRRPAEQGHGCYRGEVPRVGRQPHQGREDDEPGGRPQGGAHR